MSFKGENDLPDKLKNTKEQPRYKAPTALSLVDVQKGMGECLYIGSSDAEVCRSNGNNALGEGCLEMGMSAEGNCMAGFSIFY